MVHPSIIEARLGELGFKASRWFKAEIRELEHILMDDEKIVALAAGRYFGSFALLVATDQRLLLIDKRVFFMNLEDTRYDMISEVDYNSQVYNATLTVHTINKTHKFTTYKNRNELRALANYVQKRIMEIRHQQASPPDLVQIQSRPQPMPQPFQPVHTGGFGQPASQPRDYYVDDGEASGHTIRGHVGHVAHLIGSAATQAAARSPQIPSHLPHRHANPYMQGSLMSRHPMGFRANT